MNESTFLFDLVIVRNVHYLDITMSYNRRRNNSATVIKSYSMLLFNNKNN